MSVENTISVIDRPAFEYDSTDYTIESGRFVTHFLYKTKIKVKTGSAVELIDRHDESLDLGRPLVLKFFSPHGLTMEAPIFRLGKVDSPNAIYDEIEVLVALTWDQLQAIVPGGIDLPGFGY